MTQPSLFEWTAEELSPVTPGPFAVYPDVTQAEQFHRYNPHVLRALIKVARGLKARGLTQYGIVGLFAILRYKAIETTGDPFFRLNHNYMPFFARAIMREAPDLAGFLVTRASRIDVDNRQDAVVD